MRIGQVYEFVDKNRRFPFGYERGSFIGYTPEKFPRFMLNVERGTQCFINATDDMFEEVDYGKEEKERIMEKFDSLIKLIKDWVET